MAHRRHRDTKVAEGAEARVDRAASETRVDCFAFLRVSVPPWRILWRSELWRP